MPILVILYTTQGGEWVGGEGYSHSIHKFMEGGPTKHKEGLVPMIQGDGFASELGGIMKVAMWLCAPLSVGL